MAPTTDRPALVLHLNHGTLGVARSLGRLGIPVYAMGEDDPGGAVSSSRYLRGTIPWSFSTSATDETVDAILDVGERLGDRPVLIAGTDDLALLVAEHADRFQRRFTFPRLPPSLVSSLIDKKELYHLARSCDIPTPETAFPTSVEEAEAMARSLRFPVMLKGIDGLRLQARTGLKMIRADSAGELTARYRELENPADPNLMLQEYIPGGDDSVWMFDGYFDRDSRCRIGFTGRKLRQHPPHRGATSLGVIEENPRVRALTLRFAEAVEYRGILDVGFRYDARDDTYKLLDPNPRIGCTFRLFVGRRGLDVARALYLDLTGRRIPADEPVEGRKWMVEDWEVASAQIDLRSGELTPGQWLQDVRGVQELAWWALDDPLPALRRAAVQAPRALGWARRRILKLHPSQKLGSSTPPSTGSSRTIGVGL